MLQPTEADFKLAKIFVNHSLKIAKKEKVLIMAENEAAFNLVKATYIEILKKGAYPEVDFSGPDLNYTFFSLANTWQLKQFPKEILSAKIKWADSYIRIFSAENTRYLNQIETKKILDRKKILQPLMDQLIDTDRWLLTEYPTQALAQEAGVSLDWLTKFYYEACIVDYQKMKRQLQKLTAILDQGKKVQILGKETDLEFLIAGRLAMPCFGERNIPDGEVFMAPLVNSVNGHIFFELPTSLSGKEVQGIYLEFKDGKVVKGKANFGEETLLQALATDKGAKFLGEFAIGANYNIKQALKNTLFDEKIGGTVHLALGRSYKEKRGGAPLGANESAIHWDLVKDTRLGGSVVKVDEQIVLKNGKIL